MSGTEPPGSFGVKGLTQEIEDLRRVLMAGLSRLERKLNHMATFDQLKELLAQQKGLIQQEAAEVKAKLEEQAALIQQLSDAANNNQPVPDDVLMDLADNNTELQRIFSPAPTPAP